jgi:DNA-binding transcriptional MerR regulator/methylmalonyl-CoA mutase cobalamin-binding subunit
VTEGRLRTWERRYGIPKPGRSDTGRRLYDDDDLALIRRMVALTDAGLSAAEAAEAALSEAASGVISAGAAAAPEEAPPAVAPAVGELVTAARAFDEVSVSVVLEAAVEEHGWPQVLDAVLFPALRLTGEGWETGALTLAHEHFLSELVRRRIALQIAATPVNEDGPTVVLACPPTERHDLGLMGAALCLRLLGVHVVYLGGDVPAVALLGAIEETSAAAVVLSAVASSSRPDLVIVARAVATARQGPKVFVGGSAVHDIGGRAELMGVRLPPSVIESARLVAREVGLAV